MTDITYDPDADAAYVALSAATVSISAEVAPGVVLDYDDEGRIVGIELLAATRHIAAGGWSQVSHTARPGKATDVA